MMKRRGEEEEAGGGAPRKRAKECSWGADVGAPSGRAVAGLDWPGTTSGGVLGRPEEQQQEGKSSASRQLYLLERYSRGGDPASLFEVRGDSTEGARGGRGRLAGGAPPPTELLDAKELDDARRPADAALARWWRSLQREDPEAGQEECAPPADCNSRTTLAYVARMPLAQVYLHARVDRQRTLLAARPWDAELMVALAGSLEKIGDVQEAVELQERACQKESNCRAWKAELVRMRRQLGALERQEQVARDLGPLMMRKPKADSLCVPQPVDRRSSLSYQEFLQEYSLKSRPVIITDCEMARSLQEKWTLDFLREELGDTRATLRRSVPGSADWARLEDAETVPVSQFIDDIKEGKYRGGKQEARYLFDWSLPLHAPPSLLHRDVKIPKYFAVDFLQSAPEGMLFRETWPSLFVAPAGLVSEMHVDAFHSNFWMALFSGRKRWTFFPPEQAPLLFPDYSSSLDGVFEVNIDDPDFERHPLFQFARPSQCILEPGEVLFVPAGSPHRVENLEDSVAVSGNFVDASNVNGVLEELSLLELSDPRAGELRDALAAYWELSSRQEEGKEVEEDQPQEDVPWEVFKAGGALQWKRQQHDERERK